MELKQVKRLLHQTECGEMFMDGMGCSEPILTMTDKGLVDNFFVYLVNKEAETFTGPLSRIGLHADSGSLVYLISCRDKPFSVPPTEVIASSIKVFSEQEYNKYASLYSKVRVFAFKTHCTDNEKQVLSDYLISLGAVVNPVLKPFYKEMAPSFFDWTTKELT